MIAFYDAIRLFDEIGQRARMQWRHVLQPGEALLFDNWRVLHGRAAYTGLRRMCGGYLNREDIESRLRQLSDRPISPSRDRTPRAPDAVCDAPTARSARRPRRPTTCASTGDRPCASWRATRRARRTTSSGRSSHRSSSRAATPAHGPCCSSR